MKKYYQKFIKSIIRRLSYVNELDTKTTEAKNMTDCGKI